LYAPSPSSSIDLSFVATVRANIHSQILAAWMVPYPCLCSL
jgi:hypothetical protein